MVKQQKNTHQPTPTIPRTVRECPKERSQRRYRSGCKPRCPTAILSFLIPSRWPLRRRPQETETRPRMLTPSRRGSEAGGGRRRRWRRGEDRIGGGIWWGGGGDGVDVDAAAALYDFFFASLLFSLFFFFYFFFFVGFFLFCFFNYTDSVDLVVVCKREGGGCGIADSTPKAAFSLFAHHSNLKRKVAFFME